MKLLRTGIATAALVTSLTMFTGCGIQDTLNLLTGAETESDSSSSMEIYDPDAIQVDSNVEAPSFTKDLKGEATYAVGEKAKKLKVKAEVEGDGKISYQWYMNTVDSDGGGSIIEGATEATYRPDTSKEGHSYYFVVATNTVGSSVSMATSKIYHVYVDPDATASTDSDGNLTAGWTQTKKGWYYVGDDGKKVKNDWAQVKGKWYYFGKNGYMKTGWVKVKDVWYYLDPENGDMKTGWLTVDGKTYYLSDSGAMNTGWLDSDGSWYYSDSDGAIKKSEWVQIDGSYYYFNEDGIMLSNTEVDGKWLNPDGKLAE